MSNDSVKETTGNGSGESPCYQDAPCTVDLHRLKSLLRELNTYNSYDLGSITWVQDGQTVPVRESDVKEWRFIGMTNVAFAETHLIES